MSKSEETKFKITNLDPEEDEDEEKNPENKRKLFKEKSTTS